jgi:hypothetical protein
MRVTLCQPPPSTGRVVPPIPRPPLPPWPPGDYRTVLPWDPPHTRDFLRGDSWGVTLSGAPWVPGASAEQPERILSWFVDRYPADWQHRYLTTYAGYGYTHLKLSYADSTAPPVAPPGGPPGAGRTPAQFVETCRLVQSYGLYVHVMLGSKVYQPHDQTPDAYVGWAHPIMAELMAQNCVDEFCPGWEWDLWNVPGDTTIDIFKRLGAFAHAGGRSCWMHFSPHVTSWFADGDPRGRFGFYADIGRDIDGLNYQADSSWDCAMLQARIVDTLWQFGTEGNRHKFRLDEDVAILMFSQDHPNEDDANLRGYVACCTIDDVRHTDAKVWGFGNGGRRPDGSRI